jgi:uncharacterized repeat protein (TIGR03806 family)
MCLAVLIGSATAAYGDDASKPFGLKKREPWTTSRVVGTPEPPPPYMAKRVYPKLTFKEPVFITQEPGTDRILVAELGGKIFAFPKNNPTPESKQLFLEMKRQIYAFSFHPQYEKNGYVFVFSPDDPNDKSKEKLSRVSRFQTNLDGPRKASVATEKIIIEWPAGGHNGGEAIFGPDGYLYISTGDSTSGSDPKETGQGVDDLLSVVMRIDVDHPEGGKPYSIPKDNPFIKYPGARPEIWAHGFRNPWRMSFDKAGRLWCGDVGQDLWEMIWLVQKGGNYGWSAQEGSHPFHPHVKRGPGPILPPIVEHHHSECRSITGGYVYDGPKHPELKGVYFYGDYEYGMVWCFRYDGKQVVERRVLADTALKLATFGVTRDGEILMVDHLNGDLYELVRAPAAQANSQFPRRLSETGLFASTSGQQLATGVIPYSVNTPQWIDNAVKQRFVGVPNESKITFIETSGDASTWGFPDGTVAAETISLAMTEGNPASRKRIETRLLVKQKNQWLGYSYLWNDEQTDAALVEPRGRDFPLTVHDSQAPGGKRQQTWHIPSRNECMVCHSRAAGFVLGLRTEQMNKAHDYEGTIDNQLRAFDHVGLFTQPLKKKRGEYKALANPYDATAPVDARARAYLHVNCSVCHVTDGGGNARMILKHETPLLEMKVVNEKPMHGDFGLTNANLVAPGDPFASVLLYRFAKLGQGRMPHVGSNLTDPQGLDLLHDWILQLPRSDAKGPDTKPKEHADFVAALQALGATGSAADRRNQEIDRLLSSTRGAFLLARVVAHEQVPEPVRAAILTRASAHPDVNVRDLFERFVPESQRPTRLGDIVDVQAVLKLKGNAEHGRRLFFDLPALQCKNCHRIDRTGGDLGPDLTHIGKQYPRHELLESLVEPSRKIDPKFVTQLLVTTKGQAFTGIVVENTKQQVILNVFKDGKAEQVRLPAGEVEQMVPQKQSLMPDQLLRDLTPQQAADLLEFLVSLK